MDDDVSREEELAQPPARRRAWQIGAGLAVLAVVAGIVVGLARNDSGAPRPTTPRPTTPAPTSSAASPVANGPIIPTFATRTGDAYRSSLRVTDFVGKHRTRVTLHLQVPLLFAQCLGTAPHCSARFHVPGAVREAMRTAVPDCDPVLDDLVSRHAGRTKVADRQVLCRSHGISVLVNIARKHSSTPGLVLHDHGTQAIASHRHGPYTVQVIEQGARLTLAELRKAYALAADPRLLAGTS